MQEYMTEFDKYIKDVCDYIEERMNVVARYDTTFDRLHITPNNIDDVMFMDRYEDFHVCIDNVTNEYVLWRFHTVGAIAQQIMRVVKEEWLALLMRKESV